MVEFVIFISVNRDPALEYHNQFCEHPILANEPTRISRHLRRSYSAPAK